MAPPKQTLRLQTLLIVLAALGGLLTCGHDGTAVITGTCSAE
jgi:hypothetical protein